jgi:hypothetical protein
MVRGVRALALAAICVAAALAGSVGAAPAAPAGSRAVGLPWHGGLVGGVELPASGERFFTWDFVLRRSPNRPWRRNGTERLVRTLKAVVRAYAAAHPEAPRVGIGDLSRPEGGGFGPEYGAPGHASHQNGLDADVYYPRRDGRERPPARPGQIDRPLAQELVDRFVAAGASNVFVGPHTGLTGPPAIVEVLPSNHDNHMHARLPGDGVASAEIGRSTKGLPIRAFRLGTGHARLLVVGCIHGDECAGSVIATRLLHARPPAEGSIWVLPDLNPDGHAARRRTNANGVDLNRNFPGTWRALAVSGRRPASEVETRVAMRLIRRIRPDVTVWFHQPQALVRATGPSVGIARRFARLAGMRFRRLARPPGSSTAWQRAELPRKREFTVELARGDVDIREAGRWTHALLELAARGEVQGSG